MPDPRCRAPRLPAENPWTWRPLVPDARHPSAFPCHRRPARRRRRPFPGLSRQCHQRQRAAPIRRPHRGSQRRRRHPAASTATERCRFDRHVARQRCGFPPSRRQLRRRVSREATTRRSGRRNHRCGWHPGTGSHTGAVRRRHQEARDQSLLLRRRGRVDLDGGGFGGFTGSRAALLLYSVSTFSDLC